MSLLCVLIPAVAASISLGQPVESAETNVGGPEDERDRALVVLRRAYSAAEQLESVSYRFRTDRFGGEAARPTWAQERISVRKRDGNVHVSIGGWYYSNQADEVRPSGFCVDPGGTVYMDSGEGFWWRAADQDSGEALMMSSRVNGNLLLLVSMFGPGFMIDLESPTLKLAGESWVDGQACTVISETTGADRAVQTEYRYHIADGDGILRRIEMISPPDEVGGIRRVSASTFEDVQINPSLSDEVFSAPITAKDEIRVFSVENTETPTHETAAVTVGDRLPEFEMTTLGGETRSSSILEGPMVIDLWGIWCAPCVATMPEIEKASQNELSGKARVVGLCTGNTAAQVNDFIDRHGYTYEQYMVGNEAIEALGVFSFPTVLVIDAAGEVVYRGHPAAGEFASTVLGALK